MIHLLLKAKVFQSKATYTLKISFYAVLAKTLSPGQPWYKGNRKHEYLVLTWHSRVGLL